MPAKWPPRRESHPDLRFQRPAHCCLCHEAKWSPGKVLPPRLPGVGRTRCYFTTGRSGFTICERRWTRRRPGRDQLVHRKPKIVNRNWLRETDSHHRLRFQRATSSCYSIPQKLVEPEVVATSPCRIKSPMPVCCGFDSSGARGGTFTRTGDALDVVPLRWATRAKRTSPAGLFHRLIASVQQKVARSASRSGM